jgi:hypothetical protein
MDNAAATDIISEGGRTFKAVRVRGVRNQFGLRSVARWAAALAFFALLWCGPAQAETRVYLLRGWFGVFSTGMDELAAELKAKGIKADAIGHLSWKSTVSKIVKDRAAGKSFALVLVGHSQGANNVIEMAQALETHKISVDLLVTLAPMLQEPVPPNVVRAMNYYQNPGWGAPLVAGRGFHGKLSNIDVSSDLTITHINIDKSVRVQTEIARAILAIPQQKASPPPAKEDAAPPPER